MTPYKHTQSMEAQGFCAGISWPAGDGSLSLKGCIWKTESMITSCFPAPRQLGGDKPRVFL